MNNVIKNGKFSFVHLALMFIFLASMNLFNWFYYLIFVALAIYIIAPGHRLRFGGISSVALLVLALSWMLFSPMSKESVFSLVKPYVYFFCYMIGASMLKNSSDGFEVEKSDSLFASMTTACASGAFVHYLLNWVKNRNSSERNTIDFWTNTNVSATGQAALACFALAIAVAVLFSKNSKGKKLVAAITIVLILLYNLILSGRTLILLLLMTCVAAFLHRFLGEKKGKIKTLLVVLLVLCIIIFIFRADAFGIRSMVEDSPLYNRFFGENSVNELDEDGRWEQKLYHIQNMEKAVWGGAHIRGIIGHAHDIFFDTYDEAGVFALLGMVVYLGLTVRRLLMCLTSKTLSFGFRQRVLCIYLVAYSEFLIEPILQGMPWMFALFCLIDGYVGRVLSRSKLYT